MSQDRKRGGEDMSSINELLKQIRDAVVQPDVLADHWGRMILGDSGDWECTNCKARMSHSPTSSAWSWDGQAMNHHCGGDCPQMGRFSCTHLPRHSVH